MRKIKPSQILVFMALLLMSIILGIESTLLLLGSIPLGDFRGLVLTLGCIALVYVFALLSYRLFLKWFPLEPGEIAIGSRQEFIYQVYLLFNLVLFYPITRSGVFPVPFMRMVYRALGAKMGPDSYSSGIIFDPPFVEIGSNTIIGQFALLVPHEIEGKRLAHYPITIGNNVTIGAHAVVCAGTIIADGATVAMGAIVTKGTRIGAGEVWVGVPASHMQSR